MFFEFITGSRDRNADRISKINPQITLNRPSAVRSAREPQTPSNPGTSEPAPSRSQRGFCSADRGDVLLGGVRRPVCFFISQSLTVLRAIEGYETDVSAKTGGQVANVAVRKEMWLSLPLLVQIDDADLRAQVRGKPGFVLLRNGWSVPASSGTYPAKLSCSQSDHAAGHSRESGQSIEAENALAAARLS